MPRTHAESVIKNIISKIVQACAEKGHAVSDTLAAFMVKAVVLDPRNGFNVDRTLTKQDVQKLEELCLSKLMEKCSPSLDTIKMQEYFDMNYTSQREYVEEIHRMLETKLSPLSREITDDRLKIRSDLDVLYHKIITYILLRSSMGSPSDVNAVQEATAALQSIFPQTELGAFMVLVKKDKELQLNELTMLVTGIRLFNKANKKGEEKFNVHELMPSLLTEVLPVTSKSIKNEMSVTQSLALKYTAVLENLTDSDNQPGPYDECIILLKEALYNVRQHEVFLKILLTDACLCVKHVEILQTELSSQLKMLKDTIKPQTAVPTATIYPIFKVLSKLWSGLQDETELLNILGNIRLNLQPFLASQKKVFSEAYLDSLLETAEVKTDEQRISESSDEQIDQTLWNTQEWLMPETAASFNGLPLQYNGFCGYMLVNRDGLLLPGNPDIGVLKHKDKLYAFSSKEAALKFSSCPDYFVAKVEEKTKYFPELIQLLQQHQQFSCVSPYSEINQNGKTWEEPVTKCDNATQTVIHPMETNINKTYEWNEWELRRKALKRADLQTKATHSVQTDLSRMRQQNSTQTFHPKNAACQVKRDCGSNVPKPQIYLACLRGQKESRMVKANLTRLFGPRCQRHLNYPARILLPWFWLSSEWGRAVSGWWWMWQKKRITLKMASCFASTQLELGLATEPAFVAVSPVLEPLLGVSGCTAP
ncbi:cilia- and flagella-associated protein 206 isoform 2-T2 [Odontesthes bonariensis]